MKAKPKAPVKKAVLLIIPKKMPMKGMKESMKGDKMKDKKGIC